MKLTDCRIKREADPLGTSLCYRFLNCFCFYVCHIRLELYALRNTRDLLIPRLLLSIIIERAYHCLQTFSDCKIRKNFKNQKLF